jgi:isoprenylcysteine carboxyl methyltransferase (ICMT) family protein YpbQ
MEAATRNATHSEQLNRRNLGAQRWGVVLLVLNFIGAIVYVRLASLSWAIPQERGLHSQTGEPFVWASAVIPIFTIFFVVNVVWGGLILVRRQWRSGYLWLLTALIWLVAIVIDFAHH